MGRSYRQCSECGKTALSIATRCPGCGCELTAPALPERGVGRLSRFLTLGGVAAVLTVGAVLASAGLGQTSQPPEEQSAFTAADSIAVSAESASRVAAPAAEDAGELRVARSWTNVRKSRSVSATLEAMLMPGDTVLADSLSQGWYRVALEGEVLGYAHRSTLVALATSASKAGIGLGAPPGR
jgi:hypothetical protein